MREEWSPAVRTIEYEIDLIDAEPYEFVYRDMSKNKLLPLYIRVTYEWGKNIKPEVTVDVTWTLFTNAVRGKGNIVVGGIRRVYHHQVRETPSFILDIIARGMPVIS